LEDSVYRPIIWLGIRDVLAANQYLANGWLLETSNNSQGGCFSTARRAQQGEKFTRWDLQVKVVNGGEARELFPDTY
jgi:hypothetical protein